MDCGQMGTGKERSEARVQILPPHRGRQKTARGGRVEMEEADRRCCPDYVVGRGVLRCPGGGEKIATRTWSASCARTWNWRPKSRRRMVSRQGRPATPPGGPSEM